MNWRRLPLTALSTNLLLVRLFQLLRKSFVLVITCVSFTSVFSSQSCWRLLFVSGTADISKSCVWPRKFKFPLDDNVVRLPRVENRFFERFA